MEAAAARIEDAIHGLGEIPEPTVTIGASEGLLAYTIKPALLGEPRVELPLDRRLITRPLPRLAFTSNPRCGDIVVDATGPGELPKRQGSFHTRRIGTMKFVPVMAKKFWRDRPVVSRFDDLWRYPVIDIGIYRRMRGLAAWNALIDRADPAAVTQCASTPQIHEPLLAGRAITVLAPYSTFVDKSLAVLDLPVPDMHVSLWLTAHEDALREPEVRHVYDLLGAMFRDSAWFR
jgi:DNA-binding transcriptional LysR family regulator